MVLYVPHILLFGFAGITLAPWLVLISSDHRANAELHAHEAIHAGQQRRDGVLVFWWRYLTSKAWRLVYEVEAYHESYRVDPDRLWSYARWLAGSYGLDLDIGEAVKMIEVGHA